MGVGMMSLTGEALPETTAAPRATRAGMSLAYMMRAWVLQGWSAKFGVWWLIENSQVLLRQE